MKARTSALLSRIIAALAMAATFSALALNKNASADSPSASDQYLRTSGRASISAPADAAKIWGEFIDAFPEEQTLLLRARLNRAAALLAARDPDGAAAEAERVLKDAPSDFPHRPFARLRIAQANLAKGRASGDQTMLEKAAAEFRSLMQEASGSSAGSLAGLHLGETMDAQGRHAEAAQQFSAWAAVHENDALAGTARYLAGRSLVLAKQYDEGRQVLAQSLATGLADDQAADAHFMVGKSLYALGRKDEALAEMGQALAGKPARPDLIQLNRGDVLRSLARLDEAIAAYDNAATTAQQPFLRATGANLAGALRAERGQHAEAIKSFEAALKEGPEGALDEELRFRLAWSHLQLGDDHDVISLCTELLKRHPNGQRREPATRILALTAERIGDWKMAREAFLSLSQLCPELRVTSLRAAGDASWQLKDEAAAGKLYQEVIDAGDSPDLARAYLGLGLIKTQANEHAEAEALFRRAIAVGGNSVAEAEADRQLGHALVRQHLLAKAAEQFAGAAALRAAHSEIAADCLFQAATCLEEMNRDEQAAGCLAQLAEKFPDSRAVKEARQKFPHLILASPR
ncbi:MAG TPA: tetratricopeptide repeat protein [Pirellulales bacterium]|nr:tetratricopeptide repeat protein [Pirellulales bacterium]